MIDADTIRCTWVGLQEGLQLQGTMAGESRTPAVAAAAGRKKLQIRRKACSADMRSAGNLNLATPEMAPMQTDLESTQIKASRDVRCLCLLLVHACLLCPC